jgi:hypothetical protein
MSNIAILISFTIILLLCPVPFIRKAMLKMIVWTFKITVFVIRKTAVALFFVFKKIALGVSLIYKKLFIKKPVVEIAKSLILIKQL